MRLQACVALLAFALIGCSEESRAVNAAQDAIKQSLNDPYSAQFQNVRYVAGKSANAQPHVCGYVNAKNAFGAYVGPRPFAAKIFAHGLPPIAVVLQRRGEWRAWQEYFTPCGVTSDPFTDF